AAQLRQIAARGVVHCDPRVARGTIQAVDSQNVRMVQHPNVLTLALQGRARGPGQARLRRYRLSPDVGRERISQTVPARSPAWLRCVVSKEIECAYPPLFGAGAAGSAAAGVVAAGAAAGVWTGVPVSFS